jgi:hypothetical protein
MKKILLNKFWLTLFCGVSFTACLKDKDYEDGLYGSIRDTGGKYVSVIGGGLNNFTKSGVIISPSSPDVKTIEVTVSLDFAEKTTSPTTVKLGLDNSKIATYNAANGKNFQPVTSDMVKLKSTEVVIPAGEYYATTTMEIYQNKFDAATSYIIPVTILEAQGATLSSNLNTKYFNIIGNPLSGNYIMTGMRYNYTGSVPWTGPPAPIPANNTGTTPYSGTILASAVDAQTVQLIMGNIPDPVSGSAYYFITGNSTFSSITYDFAATFKSGYSNIEKYIVNYTPPTSTTKASFHLITKYNNTTGNAGNDRLVDQTFTHE